MSSTKPLSNKPNTPNHTTSSKHYSTLLYSTTIHTNTLYKTQHYTPSLNPHQPYSITTNSIQFNSIHLNLNLILILFHSLPSYPIPFYPTPFYSILFYSIPLHSIPFYPTLLYSTLSPSILFYSLQTFLRFFTCSDPLVHAHTGTQFVSSSRPKLNSDRSDTRYTWEWMKSDLWSTSNLDLNLRIFAWAKPIVWIIRSGQNKPQSVNLMRIEWTNKTSPGLPSHVWTDWVRISPVQHLSVSMLSIRRSDFTCARENRVYMASVFAMICSMWHKSGCLVWDLECIWCVWMIRMGRLYCDDCIVQVIEVC